MFWHRERRSSRGTTKKIGSSELSVSSPSQVTRSDTPFFQILKELTTSKSQQPPPKEKSSSVFYVSATVESENTGEKLGDQQLERKSHSSTTETSGGTPSVRTMGGNQSNPAGIQERDSRESWNEKSSSSRTSSSSNYHSESSPFQNSHDQVSFTILFSFFTTFQTESLFWRGNLILSSFIIP